MQGRKLAEYAREKPSYEPEGHLVISTDDDDVTKALLSALAILEKNKSEHEAVKFIYRGQEIGNISKESIVNYIHRIYLNLNRKITIFLVIVLA
jgi:hypothetical protein